MSFCVRDHDTLSESSTVVDNKFLLNYMADAPEAASKVYLTGLALCALDSDGNTAEYLAQHLNLSARDVMDAYLYWEELGLVRIVEGDDPKVIYLPARDSASMLKKIKPGKYAKFNKEIQNVLTERMITVNEYNEYYMFLENRDFQPEALVAVAKYCRDLKGADINYPYILTVARNQYDKGARTLTDVSESLGAKSKYDDDLKFVFKALKTERRFDYSDRVLYEKWTDEMGFSPEVVIYAAKKVKSGGMKRLDSLLDLYYRNGVLSSKEIEAYESKKSELYETAKSVNKNLGVYYGSLDAEIEEYVSKWLLKGYDADTLCLIARYCFRNGIRSLSGMDEIINKFYKKGIVAADSLDAYLAQLTSLDGRIKNFLEKTGLVRNVTNSDRQFYRNWTDNWGFDEDVIILAAEKAAGTASPFGYANKVLSEWKTHNVKTAEEASKLSSVSAAVAKRDFDRIEKHDYSDEELDAMFTDIKNVEI